MNCFHLDFLQSWIFFSLSVCLLHCTVITKARTPSLWLPSKRRQSCRRMNQACVRRTWGVPPQLTKHTKTLAHGTGPHPVSIPPLPHTTAGCFVLAPSRGSSSHLLFRVALPPMPFFHTDRAQCAHMQKEAHLRVTLFIGFFLQRETFRLSFWQIYNRCKMFLSIKKKSSTSVSLYQTQTQRHSKIIPLFHSISHKVTHVVFDLLVLKNLTERLSISISYLYYPPSWKMLNYTHIYMNVHILW